MVCGGVVVVVLVMMEMGHVVVVGGGKARDDASEELGPYFPASLLDAPYLEHIYDSDSCTGDLFGLFCFIPFTGISCSLTFHCSSKAPRSDLRPWSAVIRAYIRLRKRENEAG